VQDIVPYLSGWKGPFAKVEADAHSYSLESNTTGFLVGAFVVGFGVGGTVGFFVGTGVGGFVVIGAGVGTGVGGFVLIGAGVGTGVGGFEGGLVGGPHASALWQSSSGIMNCSQQDL